MIFFSIQIGQNWSSLCRLDKIYYEKSWKISIQHNSLAKFYHSISKVENISKGSLDSIPSPSPSAKIQNMGGKVCLRWKGKTLLGIVDKLFIFKCLLTTPSNVLPLHLKNILSCPWLELSMKVKVMGSNLGYLLKSSLL